MRAPYNTTAQSLRPFDLADPPRVSRFVEPQLRTQDRQTARRDPLPKAQRSSRAARTWFDVERCRTMHRRSAHRFLDRKRANERYVRSSIVVITVRTWSWKAVAAIRSPHRYGAKRRLPRRQDRRSERRRLMSVALR
jgi:hypothetical protein